MFDRVLWCYTYILGRHLFIYLFIYLFIIIIIIFFFR